MPISENFIIPFIVLHLLQASPLLLQLSAKVHCSSSLQSITFKHYSRPFMLNLQYIFIFLHLHQISPLVSMLPTNTDNSANIPSHPNTIGQKSCKALDFVSFFLHLYQVSPLAFQHSFNIVYKMSK